MNMTKQQLAQKRNYFKFILAGMHRKIDNDVLTLTELENWNKLLELRAKLINSFESNSKYMGLKVPEHRCWCGKEGKYINDYAEKGEEPTWSCKKHLNN